MAPLKDFSGGAERFKIGLTLVFCTAAIKGLLLKFLNGGLSNGPITYSFLIQLATVSVIHLPYLKQTKILEYFEKNRKVFRTTVQGWA